MQAAFLVDRNQCAVLSHKRLGDRVGMVVKFSESSSLGAGIALAERMIAVASYLDDLITVLVDDHAALRRADLAVSSLGSDFSLHLAVSSSTPVLRSEKIAALETARTTQAFQLS